MQFHYATMWETVADAVPNRTALIHNDTRRTWAELDMRAAKLAGAFVKAGLKPDSKIGHYLYNCNEYIEAHYAAFKMRASPINVNYRYLEDELTYLLDNSDAEAVLFHGRLAERIANVRKKLPKLKLLIQVDDGQSPIIDGAVEYEKFLASSQPMPRIERPADDIYMLYTGGTTGMPKGVMYHHGDHSGVMMMGFDFRGLPRPTNLEELAATVKKLAEMNASPISIPACPLMHGTGIWVGAFITMMTGGTVVTLPNINFDPDLLWSVAVQHKVSDMVIVGDTFAKPMVNALDAAAAAGRPYDLGALVFVISSGVMWSQEVKQQMLQHKDMFLIDAMGSTEGSMGRSITTRNTQSATAKFDMGEFTKVFNDKDELVKPGSDEIGMIAAGGMVPVGYFKDPEKSAKTFRTVDGVRYSFPGDFAMVNADGTIKLLGRGSASVNSGGEKIFPEEVEEAVKRHPSVYDCLVVGIPDDRFGEKVTAVASARPGQTLDERAIIEEARKHIAAYKLPKHVIAVPEVPRAPNGKADYKTAKMMAAEALGVKIG